MVVVQDAKIHAVQHQRLEGVLENQARRLLAKPSAEERGVVEPDGISGTAVLGIDRMEERCADDLALEVEHPMDAVRLICGQFPVGVPLLTSSSPMARVTVVNRGRVQSWHAPPMTLTRRAVLGPQGPWSDRIPHQLWNPHSTIVADRVGRRNVMWPLPRVLPRPAAGPVHSGCRPSTPEDWTWTSAPSPR